MTERLADLTQHIRGIRQLDTVVGAMRAIAATRARQGRGLLAGVHAYAQIAAGAIAQALRLMPDQPSGGPEGRGGKAGAILFCAELGFAGALTDRILDRAEADLGDAEVFVIGTRGILVAEQRQIRVAWSTKTASHAGAVTAVASRIADALYDRVREKRLTRVDVVYPTWTAEGGVRVARHMLLPVDAPPAADRQQPPLTTLPPALLLELLAEEYILAQLCECAMQAFVAENEARVAAMISARSNIERMLGELQSRERRVRQEEITAEVVELAGGAGCYSA